SPDTHAMTDAGADTISDSIDLGEPDPCTGGSLEAECWTATVELLPRESFTAYALAVEDDNLVRIAGRETLYGKRELTRYPDDEQWTLGGWPTPSGVVVDLGGYLWDPVNGYRMLKRAGSSPDWDWTYKLGDEYVCPNWSRHDWIESLAITHDADGRMFTVADFDGVDDQLEVCVPLPGGGYDSHVVTPHSGSIEADFAIRVDAEGWPQVLLATSVGLELFTAGDDLDSWSSEVIYEGDGSTPRGRMLFQNVGETTHVVSLQERYRDSAGPYAEIVYLRLTDDGLEDVRVLVARDADPATNFDLVLLDFDIDQHGNPVALVAGPLEDGAGHYSVYTYRVLHDSVERSRLVRTQAASGRTSQIAFAPDGRVLFLTPEAETFQTNLHTLRPVESR
ncbi:MAG: hypothetical protein KC561_19290, partial [Myxococcales bacterium]|nr:hypothetical protein [Myxococcales bacterium]